MLHWTLLCWWTPTPWIWALGEGPFEIFDEHCGEDSTTDALIGRKCRLLSVCGLWLNKVTKGSGQRKMYLLSNNQPELSAAETRVYGADKVYSTHLDIPSLVNDCSSSLRLRFSDVTASLICRSFSLVNCTRKCWERSGKIKLYQPIVQRQYTNWNL